MNLREQLAQGQVGLARVGGVRPNAAPHLPYVAVDAVGQPIEVISAFLRDLVLSDCRSATCRSYAHDLLRWFRLLATIDLGWERATRGEVALLVAWMRQAPNPPRRRRDPRLCGAVNLKTSKPNLAAGYARTTINHTLTVVIGFYDFHLHCGAGPVINPVPAGPQRRQLLAHRSPLEPVPLVRRSPLRQKIPDRQPRSIPDRMWADLFGAMRCTRDRALLACYVSSGSRASELLGLRAEDIDWPGMRLWVMLPRLQEIEADLLTRRARADSEGWLGEIEGLDLTLTFLRGKRKRLERTATSLGMPVRKEHGILARVAPAGGPGRFQALECG